MPVDSKKIKLLISEGVSAICACCENFHERVIERQAPSCGEKCGGPMAGGAFDKYRGPLTDFSKICFVCMEPATHAVRAKDNPRVLGCCRKHVEIISKYKPADKPAVDIVIVSEDGPRQVDKDTIIPEKISLKLS